MSLLKKKKGRARYSLRDFGASHTRASILDSEGGGLGLHREAVLAPNLEAVVAGRPRTSRQAEGRGLQPRCQAENFPLGPGFHHHGNYQGVEAEFLRIPGRLYGGGKNKKRSPEQALSGQGRHPNGPHISSLPSLFPSSFIVSLCMFFSFFL